MIVSRHSQFKKHFKKRVLPSPKLASKFEERLRLFLADPENQLLKNHQLKGKKKNYYSFSITGDIRVVYKIKGNILQLYDIGTHNQVY